MSELWTGTEGLTGRGAMACKTVPGLGMKMVAGGWGGTVDCTGVGRKRGCLGMEMLVVSIFKTQR